MPNQFYKGRTNNHLTWVMVDATDFATPESALSAATKIKIYGKLRGATGTNLVSSGAGSLTNDITHVGASALGIYTIALAKADLSDASAAWYDQYIISFSATGAAYQALVVDGGIDASALSGYQSRLSDLASYLVVMSGVQSDIYSALILTQSMASDAASAAQQANSRTLVLVSSVSDMQSYLTAMSGVLSDAYSAVILTQSMASDAASAAQQANSRVLVTQSMASDAASAAAQANSRALVVQSMISDTYSQLSDFRSDLHSFVSTTGVGLNPSTISDLRSAIAAGPAATITASDISDIASAVKAALVSDLSDILSAATQVNSRALVNQSRVSDIYSMLSDLYSDFQSRVPQVAATTAAIVSAVWSNATAAALASRVLVIKSAASDTLSAVLLTQSMASDAASAAQQASSRVLVTKSAVSDIYSLLTAAQVEPTAVISPTATFPQQIAWLTALSRNKITETATVQSLRNDADNADIASAAVSDDGTTFTRGEFA